jgi:hypothetical protein
MPRIYHSGVDHIISHRFSTISTKACSIRDDVLEEFVAVL